MSGSDDLTPRKTPWLIRREWDVDTNKLHYRRCMQVIRRVSSEVILGHYWLEYFQHRAMARMTCDTWFQSGWACSADLGEPHFARAMYQVLTPERLGCRQENANPLG